MRIKPENTLPSPQLLCFYMKAFLLHPSLHSSLNILERNSNNDKHVKSIRIWVVLQPNTDRPQPFKASLKFGCLCHVHITDTHKLNRVVVRHCKRQNCYREPHPKFMSTIVNVLLLSIFRISNDIDIEFGLRILRIIIMHCVHRAYALLHDEVICTKACFTFVHIFIRNMVYAENILQ